MGYFKTRRALAVGGGFVQIGADTNLYRTAANVLKTDDALTVAGVSTLTGLSTLSAGFNAAAGTQAALPYSTASPTVDTNGQIGFTQKGNRTYLTFYAGGTPFHVMFPQTTHGTITTTVGGTP